MKKRWMTGLLVGATLLLGSEQMMVKSIGNTDTFNIPDIHKLQVTIDANANSATYWFKVINTSGSTKNYLARNVNEILFTEPGTYRMKIVENGGTVAYWPVKNISKIKFEEYNTGIDEQSPAIEDGLILLGNYPNPFNPSTCIRFILQHGGLTSVDVYSQAGQLITTIHNGFLPAGQHSLQWDTTQSGLTSGLYFLKVSHAGTTNTSRMLLLK